MKIQRAFKVRVYPSDEQWFFLNKTLGSCGFLYNKMLGERIKTYESLKDNRKVLSAYMYKTEKKYKQEYEFLKKTDTFALQQVRRNLESAYTNFYQSLEGLRKGEQVGFPRFKAKCEHNDRYRTGMAVKMNFNGKTVKLPKLGCPVRFKHRINIKSWYRTAVLKNISVSRTPTDKYFASCLFEGEQDYTGLVTKLEKIIGLDMSLSDFYVNNVGNSPAYRRVYRVSEKRLARLQRKLTNYKRDMNVAINFRNFGKNIPVQCRESTSVGMAALALGDKGETVVGKPVTGRSRNLVEQAKRLAQATSTWF